MKRKLTYLSLTILACCICVSAQLSQSAPAQSTSTTTDSTFWSPISGTEVPSQVRQNSKNALALHQLWWRARLHSSVWYYVLAVRDLTRSEPKNAVALAAYSDALMDCFQNYQTSASYKKARADLGNDLSIAGIRALLEKAKKLDSEQWLIWITESKMVPYEGNGWTTLGERAEKAARRAVEISNNSLTNLQLAYVLQMRAVWDYDKSYIDKAITVAKRAQTMKPLNPEPSLLLLSIYRDQKKNTAEAKKAQQAILATIPTGVTLSDKAKAFLRKKNVPVP